MPDLTPEDLAETAELDRLVREALQKLIEHSDSCQIFITKRLENGKGETYRQVSGLGNSYARFGLVREWVTEQEGIQSRRYSDDIDDET